jgi:hypothetical protein
MSGFTWYCSSWEENMSMTQPYFALFVIIPLWKGLGPSFHQTWIHFMQEWFVSSLIEIGQMFHFKRFFQIYCAKIAFPLVAPLNLWGPSFVHAWICTIAGSFYVNMSYFWLSGSWEEIFLMISPHICIFVIISPWTRTWPFIYTIFYSLYTWMICTKFEWNWPTGSGEDFFLI